ncbi:TOBE-like domain-containing protein [soil metagenome]
MSRAHKPRSRDAQHRDNRTAPSLNKSFGKFKAVDDVSFAAAEGKITALLGPSGSGKSTVLRMIAGLESVDSGQSYLGGDEQTFQSVQDRRVGFVFQHYALFRHMTVRQNVAFGLAVRKEAKDSRIKRVDELLELVQLGPFAHRFPDQLSGGAEATSRPRARALAPRPQVLLLDEPFGALDARVRQDLREWLDRLHRELGITSQLVTHDQEEALELADQIVFMHEGRVQQIGTSDDVYNHPAAPFIAGFVGAANVIEGLAIGGRVQFGEQHLAGAAHLKDGTPAHAYIRQHDVHLSSTPLSGLSSTATVERIASLGWMSKVHLELPGEQHVTATVRNGELIGVKEGQGIYVDLRNAKIFAPEESLPSDELAVM